MHHFILENSQDPDFQNAPREKKKTTVAGWLRGNMVAAFEEFKAKNPDVAFRYAQSGLKKLLDKAPPEDRDGIQQDYLQAIQEQLQTIQSEMGHPDATDPSQPSTAPEMTQ